MPYIIITTPRPTHDQLVARIDGVELPATRTAVATLEEAWDKLPPGCRDTDLVRLHFALDNGKGGTIGPLPDGTVIEVRHVDWIAMRTMAGHLPVRTHDKPAVLAAFNGVHA